MFFNNIVDLNLYSCWSSPLVW